MTQSKSTRTRTKSAFADALLQAEALKFEGEARIAEEKVRDARPNLTSRELRILGGIGPQVSATAISVFSRWNRMDAANGNKPPRIIFMDAAQGTFADMFAVYDVLRVAQANNGPEVTVQTTGMADTKGAIAMQAAKHRIMTPRSWIILTEIQPNPQRLNSAEGIEAVKYMKWLEDRGWKLLLERSNGKLDLATIKEKTEYGRQWWLTADEALQYGLIDEIGTVMPGYVEQVTDPALLPVEGDSWKTRLEKAELRLLTAQGSLAGIVNTLDDTSAENAGKTYFFGEVDTESCTNAQTDLLTFAQRKRPDVEMIINTPGGSVTAGAGLMDVIEQTTADRNFTTTIFGQCASMGGFIAQTGKRRVMARNAAFLIHRVSTIFGQSSSHMDDNNRNMKRLEDSLFPFMANRTGGKLSIDELRAKCANNDWWLTADECLEKGLVDELI